MGRKMMMMCGVISIGKMMHGVIKRGEIMFGRKMRVDRSRW